MTGPHPMLSDREWSATQPDAAELNQACILIIKDCRCSICSGLSSLISKLRAERTKHAEQQPVAWEILRNDGSGTYIVPGAEENAKRAVAFQQEHTPHGPTWTYRPLYTSPVSPSTGTRPTREQVASAICNGISAALVSDDHQRQEGIPTDARCIDYAGISKRETDALFAPPPPESRE